ncbi:MAG: ORF6N domain-containing protein [Candidatus Margulisiibacteriota bacterium]
MVKSAEKSNSQDILSVERLIYVIRGQKVIIDKDLAILYGVSTGRLNEQVKRNIKRFPDDFMFRLTREEYNVLRTSMPNLISQNAMSSYGGRRHIPLVFTEQGIAMLSGILNSDRAILVNIAIMRAFVKIRQMIAFNKDLAQKLSEIEHKLGQHDQDIISLFGAITKIMRDESKPKNKFGFV